MNRTPFYQYHVDHGGQMVEFAGWEMPIRYTSIMDENRQVRNSGGLFDVSHMGRVRFTGSDARRFLERICTRRVHDMAQGQCRYSLVCNERGGVRDDVLIYRYDEQDFMLVVNAANRDKLLDHFNSQRDDLDVRIEDQTLKTGMVALQGPSIIELIGRFSSEIPTLRKYRFTTKGLLGVKITISRTGYTGEDGVEVVLPANVASMAIKMLAGQLGGAEDTVRPIGLGARDTLRLEAGMPLYGHEMDEDTDPISAGLMFGINLDKDEGEDGEKFIGQDALKKIHDEGPKNRLVGLLLEGKRTARQGMEVQHGGLAIGRVTSGCLSPTLDRSIAMAYVPGPLAEPGASVQVDLGRQTVNAEVTSIPFYKRPKK